MNAPANPDKEWSEVVAELAAYREAERKLWGDVDDMTVARFVGNTCSKEERQLMETAMAAYPAVRELVEVVREIIPAVATAPAAEPSLAKALWGQAQQQVRRLTEQLSTWVDETGVLLTAGLQRCLLDVEPAYGTLGSSAVHEQPGRATWEIPCSDAYRVAVAFWPATTANQWNLACRLRCGPGVAWPLEARFEVRNEAGALELSGPLPRDFQEPFFLASGTWRLIVRLGKEAWEIPLGLGR